MDKSREQFEAWAEKNGHDVYRSGGVGAYYFQSTQWSWDIWQASRAAVEIELPGGVDTREALSRGFMCDYAAGMDRGIADCAEKIVEHGLKVKQ